MEFQQVQAFMDHPMFESYEIRPANFCHTERQQWIFTTRHGLEVSVTRGSTTFGGSQGLFELAILEDGLCCYTTPITSDVLGYLSESEVLEVLDQAAVLIQRDGEWIPAESEEEEVNDAFITHLADVAVTALLIDLFGGNIEEEVDA